MLPQNRYCPDQTNQDEAAGDLIGRQCNGKYHSGNDAASSDS